jgi:hypothetical protein
MTLKDNTNQTLELPANPSKPHTADTSGNHAANHEEIRRRAYEFYLEREGLGGNELDDWLQAEAELGRDALVTRTTKITKLGA